MGVVQGLHRFELDYDLNSHEQVPSMLARFNPMVVDRKLSLCVYPQPALTQLDDYRFLTDRSQKTWTKPPMDLDGGPNDLLGQLTVNQRYRQTSAERASRFPALLTSCLIESISLPNAPAVYVE